MFEKETREAKAAAAEFLSLSGLNKGDLAVIGCSTSEIASERIGSFSNADLGEAVFLALYQEFKVRGIFLAAQCCEHLNRALIIEEEAAKRFGLEPVNVIPQPKAGGSFATAAYKHMENPVAVEKVRAKGGMDIGDTLIGMHLREVAVPVRLNQDTIGGARVICARVRPKFVGGSRAVYDEKLL